MKNPKIETDILTENELKYICSYMFWKMFRHHCATAKNKKVNLHYYQSMSGDWLNFKLILVIYTH